ncbi:MAG: septation protein A [Legionellales bacterium]|nr:septation protein A [Legionellales bacterium]
MKLLFDFFPIALFFLVYQWVDIYAATAVAMIASVVQVSFYWFLHKRVEPMHLITLVLIILLGGATLILQNEWFIKWKPTVINWLFAVILFSSHYWSQTPLLQRMLNQQISLPNAIWLRLSYSWIVFFSLMGTLNLIIAYTFSTDVWVHFKLFGMLGLTLVFVVIQAIFLAKHVSPMPQTSDDH